MAKINICFNENSHFFKLLRCVQVVFLIGLITFIPASCINSEHQKESFRLRASASIDGYYSLDDIEAEIKFGRDLAARILGNYSLIKNKPIMEYVNRVGKGLSQFSGRPEIKFCFGVLKSKESNAFATPGGYIFITEGLLRKIENESELAGVLAHEIAHVTNRHVIKRINLRAKNDSGLAGLSDLLGSSTAAYRSAADVAFNEATKILFETGYKASDEIDADQTGILICALAGYDPFGLKNALVKTEGFELKDTSYNGDQPFRDKRMMEINRIIAYNGLYKTGNSKVSRRFKENVSFK